MKMYRLNIDRHFPLGNRQKKHINEYMPAQETEREVTDFNDLIEIAASKGRGLIQLSLYVNFPFCRSKCKYCFYVNDIPTNELVRSEMQHESYVRAVQRQIDSVFKAINNNPKVKCIIVKNIYFGGGTPSILTGPQLAEILKTLKSYRQFLKEGSTTTIEVSPDTVDFAKLECLRQGGFDRLSIGLQSYDDVLLKKMGRAARCEDIDKAVLWARQAGFDNVSLDIMYGLPEETLESWKGTVDKAIELSPDHVCAYRYSPISGPLEKMVESKKFFSIPYAERLERSHYAEEALTRAGYTQYIAGYYHKNNKKCEMDIDYFGLEHDWLGFGAGAISLFGEHFEYRAPDRKKYISAPESATYLQASQVPLNYYYNTALHLPSGFDFQTFKKRFGLSFPEILERNPDIERSYRKLLQQNKIEPSAAGLQWKNKSARSQWICRDLDGEI